MGGTGTYEQLALTGAAFYAPLILIEHGIALVVLVFPGFVSLVSIAFFVYTSLLMVTAVKAVHNLGWGKALISSFLVLAILLGRASILAVNMTMIRTG